MSDLSNPIFHDEAKAREWLEARLWANGPICPKCGKRGINGTFHHVSQQHLKRYLAEFDFRYNERVALGVNDADRMSKSISGIVGKRLTYRRANEAKNDQT
jgi:hypothetical protein